MSATFNTVDLIFIAFTIICVLTAFFRGFVKEVFALLAWVVAITASYFFTPYALELLQTYFKNIVVVDISLRSIVFISVFLVTVISTSGLCEAAQNKVPKVFDRSLGVLFGFAKTIIIFGFIYAVALNMFGYLLGKKSDDTHDKMPSWVKEARCYSLLRFSGEIFDPVVEKLFNAVTKNLDRVIPKDDSPLDEKIDEVMDKNSSSDASDDSAAVKKDAAVSTSSASTSNAPAAAAKDSGYNKKDIEKMDHLIEILDKK